jgi:hypothetical protein
MVQHFWEDIAAASGYKLHPMLLKGESLPSELTATAPRFHLLPITVPREHWAGRWLGVLMALAITALYAVAIFSYWAPAAQGSNENGYLQTTMNLARDFSPGFKPESDFEFVGRMYIFNPQTGYNYAKYPLGVPVLGATLMWIFGTDQTSIGPTLAWAVSPICGSLGVLGMFFLARRLCGTYAGLIAMLLLGCSQVMFTFSVRAMSHAPSICFLTWGLFFLVAFLQNGRVLVGLLAGLFVGFAFTIRYTDGLVGLSLGLAVLMMWRWNWMSVGLIVLSAIVGAGLGWLAFLFGNGDVRLFLSGGALAAIWLTMILYRPWSAWVLTIVLFGWAIPVGLQITFNLHTFGTLTGYDSTNESTGFALSYFRYNWERVIRLLNDQAMFFVVPMSIVGGAWMLFRQTRMGIILLAATLPTLGIYSTYYFAQETGVQFSRFLSSALPGLVVLAVWMMHQLIASSKRWQATGMRIGVGAVTAIACAVPITRSIGMVGPSANLGAIANVSTGVRENWNLAQLGTIVARVAPPGSMVIGFGDDRFGHYLQTVGDWQFFTIGWFDQRESRSRFWRMSEDEEDPDPFDPARIKHMRSVLEGKSQRDLDAELRKLVDKALDQGRSVVAIQPAERLMQLPRRGFKYTRLAIVDGIAGEPQQQGGNNPGVFSAPAQRMFVIKVERDAATSRPTNSNASATSRPASQPSTQPAGGAQ